MLRELCRENVRGTYVFSRRGSMRGVCERIAGAWLTVIPIDGVQVGISGCSVGNYRN
jgi:hypothetical protein